MTDAKSVEIQDFPVNYRVEGDGEPLVLIHGLGGSSDWWVRNVGFLSRHFTVYTVDLPGFGAMRRCPAPFSVDSAVAWLRTFLDALGLEQVSLIGHSMGGLIAAIFAAESPERLKRIVLAAPAMAMRSNRVAAYFLPLARETLRIERSFWKILIWDSARAGFSTSFRAARDLLRYKMGDEFSRITTPCLLIWGERDPLVPATLGRDLREKIQGSQLCVLKDAGHVLMYDHAEQFNNAVLAFLSERDEVHRPDAPRDDERLQAR
jgi:pimeloyl-ACP methyl ester carboxylesterase